MATEEAAKAEVPPPSRPPRIATRSDITVRANTGRRVLMSWPPFTTSERRPEDLGRRFEGHTLRLRDWGRKRPHEWRPVVVDLPPQQHRVVFVRGVVAVLHEHPAEVSELHRDGDASLGTEAIDILAPPLPCRHVARAPVAGEDLPLLEVDVDRVIPVILLIDQGPDLAGAGSGRCRDPPEVRSEYIVFGRPDAPWAAERRDGVVGRLPGFLSEPQGPLPGHRHVR